jgi:carbamoyltransferase
MIVLELVAGLLWLGGTLALPGVLLAEALIPSVALPGRRLIGLAIGLLVVPTLAFGAAMAFGTNMRPATLAAVAVAVALPSAMVVVRRNLRQPPLRSLENGQRRVMLAIHEDSNANAALFVDGELVAAVAEERFTRRRYQAGFPEQSIAECLRLAAVDGREVTDVACGNLYHVFPRLPFAKPPQWDRSFLGAVHWIYLAYQQIVPRLWPVNHIVTAYSRAALTRRFDQAPFLIDHHRAHAASAVYSIGWDSCLAVTMDNFGDGSSATAWSWNGAALQELRRVAALHSPGQFYGEIAELLGIHPLLAGKVTGMAAHGDAARCMEHVEELFALSADRRRFVLHSGARWGRGHRAMAALCEHAARGGKADIAAASQRRLEEVVTAWIAALIEETGLDRVALAGGVFGNVRLNQRIAALPTVREVWVHPAMSDAGIAVGAALAVLGEARVVRPQRLANVYLGPHYSDAECEAALRRAGVAFRRSDDPVAEAARLVAEGRVVARFAGRLEYGPRALGNRSILYKTDDPSVNQWLNERLGRAEYMPFAPATIAEEAARMYVGLEKAADAARFMTVCFDCTDEMKRLSPAVVHVDGTARPQVVHAADAPDFHRLITLVYQHTGRPSVINTSFNMHEEPIVCAPDDALRAWKTARLDALVLGPFVVAGRLG